MVYLARMMINRLTKLLKVAQVGFIFMPPSAGRRCGSLLRSLTPPSTSSFELHLGHMSPLAWDKYGKVGRDGGHSIYWVLR
jgi:hypothetical protein